MHVSVTGPGDFQTLVGSVRLPTTPETSSRVIDQSVVLGKNETTINSLDCVEVPAIAKRRRVCVNREKRGHVDVIFGVTVLDAGRDDHPVEVVRHVLRLETHHARGVGSEHGWHGLVTGEPTRDVACAIDHDRFCAVTHSKKSADTRPKMNLGAFVGDRVPVHLRLALRH